jgi:hypothetical protein
MPVVVNSLGSAALSQLLVDLASAGVSVPTGVVLFAAPHGDSSDKALVPIDAARPIAAQFDAATQWLVLRRPLRRKLAADILGSIRRASRRATSELPSFRDRDSDAAASSATASGDATAATAATAPAVGSGADAASSVEVQFGAPLDAVMARVGGLPTVVRRCVAHIEQHGMQSEGLYRLSGSATRIAEFKQLVDSGGDLWFSTSEPTDNVSGVLKLYLRELPDTVLTTRLYAYFLTASFCTDVDALAHFLRAPLMALPKPNLMMAEFLLRHLHKVSTLSAANKMSTMNLSTIFAPTLLQPSPHAMLSNTGNAHPVIQLLIQSVADVFDFRKPLPFCAAGVAEHAYVPAEENAADHLQFAAGQVLYFTERNESQWWPAVTTDGRRGLVPTTFVRVELDFDEFERALLSSRGQSSSSSSSSTAAATKTDEATIRAVAKRAEADLLKSELKAAAPGVAVVRSAAPSSGDANDAMNKILALQDQQATLVAQRTAAARIASLQQKHHEVVSQRLHEAVSQRSSTDASALSPRKTMLIDSPRSSSGANDDEPPGATTSTPPPATSAGTVRKVSSFRARKESAASIVRSLLSGSPVPSPLAGSADPVSKPNTLQRSVSAVSVTRLRDDKSPPKSPPTSVRGLSMSPPRPLAVSSSGDDEVPAPSQILSPRSDAPKSGESSGWSKAKPSQIVSPRPSMPKSSPPATSALSPRPPVPSSPAPQSRRQSEAFLDEHEPQDPPPPPAAELSAPLPGRKKSVVPHEVEQAILQAQKELAQAGLAPKDL